MTRQYNEVMTTVAPEDSWVSIAEAAAQLAVHPRTLRRYIKEGRLPVLRLSPQIVRIRPEDISRFRAEHIKLKTGTGTSYVVRERPALTSIPTGAVPIPARPAEFRPGPRNLG